MSVIVPEMGPALLRVRRLLHKPLPVRVALALLALGAMLPTLIFFALEYRVAISEKQAEIERQGRAFARNMADDVTREIAVKTAQLAALATSTSLRAGDYAAADAQAREAAATVTGSIALFRVDGAQLFNTQAPPGTALEPAMNLDMIRRVVESGGIESSNIFRSRINDSFMVTVVCPVPRTNLVLTGSLPVAHLNEVLARSTPDGWVSTLVDAAGKVIARSQNADPFVGMPADAHDHAVAAPDGWVAANGAGADGIFASWHRLSNGWIAMMAVPRATVEGPMRRWRTDVLWSLVVFSGLAFISAALVGEWIIRSMTDLTRAAGAIGRGEDIEATESSIHEVNEVGMALAQACRDRRQGELANAHLAALVTSSGDAIMSIALDGTIETWNAAAEELYGYRADEAIRRPLGMLIPGVRMRELEDKIAAARAGRSMRLETVRRRKDGSLIEVSLDAAPILSSDRKVVGVSVISHDISRRKRSEAHMQFVMRELSHRTKNLITVIIAMARRTARQSADFNDFETKFTGRLHGLARSHDLLVHMDWMGAPIEELVRSQLLPFVSEPDCLHTEGPHLFLRPEAVQNLGFALHELASNAQKFGALCQSGGRVTIRWEVQRCSQGERRIHLSWNESGGPVVEEPAHAGFGSTVIQKLTEASLNAKVSMAFAPEGFCWSVEMPAKEVLIDGNGSAPTPLSVSAKQAS